MMQIENMPEVSNEVAKLAGEVVSFALLNDIKIENIDLDALGGVAIYLSNIYWNKKISDKEIWISILNNGTITVLEFGNHSNVISLSLDYDVIMDFLFND